MNLKSIGIRTAVTAAVAVGSVVIGVSPSEAANIGGGGTLEIRNDVQSNAQVVLGGSGEITNLNFVGVKPGSIQVSDGTGMFASYIGSFGTIQNLAFSGGVSGPVNSFFSIAPDLVFDLSSAVATVSGTSANFDFEGLFANSSGSVLGSGTLTTQVKLKNGIDGPSSFSISTDAEAVPTPALLPGFLAMGAAALRRRDSAEEAEVVEA